MGGHLSLRSLRGTANLAPVAMRSMQPSLRATRGALDLNSRPHRSTKETRRPMARKDEREPFYRIDVAEAKEMLADPDVVVIDVREPFEYQAGHIPHATLIPVNSVFARREELPKDKKIIFACAVGQRSALAAEMAAAAGLPPDRLYNLDGGTEAWRKAGEPVE